MLTFNEIKEKLPAFILRWQDCIEKEIAETQTFWNELFELFGQDRKAVVLYEKSVEKLNGAKGRIDLFWPKMLIVEQKGPNIKLDDKVRQQAVEYALAIPKNLIPRYIVLCNFKEFKIIDLEDRDEYNFSLSELEQNIEHLSFIGGYQQNAFYNPEDDLTIKATQALRNFYYNLVGKKGTSYINKPSAELNLFMIRLTYCFFADSTSIFSKNNHLSWCINNFCSVSYMPLRGLLAEIFEVLNTKDEERSSALEEHLKPFPYVNGQLFAGQVYIPTFNTSLLNELKSLFHIKWGEINPSIFGSIFQNFAEDNKRREQGEHYTSEKNIFKLISPLFLDNLENELAKCGNNDKKLQAFTDKLSGLTFLDPACGCGNFLVIAYREIRRLELKALKLLHSNEKQSKLDVKYLSQIATRNFCGIEIDSFASQIAQLAMWITDHQMNHELSRAFGQYIPDLPLKPPSITQANALTTDWASIVNPTVLSYILGNPPFVGYYLQNETQKEELRTIFEGAKDAGYLDYVACWYKKAVDCMKLNPSIKSAFVSTNSIIQGTQVAPLWKPLLQEGVHIHFAHQTFSWANEAGNNAKVHCVIIGFALFDIKEKQLWIYNNPKDEEGVENKADNINPYLLNAPNIIVEARSKPLDENRPQMIFGSMPVDNGNFFFFSQEEKDDFIEKEPKAAKFIHPCLGSEEFINNKPRYCLWLVEATPVEIRSMPLVKKRVEAIEKFRSQSKKAMTRKFAKNPTIFQEIRHTYTDCLLIPSVSSEKREYVPIGYVDKEVIITNACHTLPNASHCLFGLITSKMHMCWLRAIGGRLESRYRYSNTIVYNTFPFPKLNPKQEAKITALAEELLAIRQAHLDNKQTYAALYDPLVMPRDLLKAHQKLDKEVDKAYGFDSTLTEQERIEFLLRLYATS